MKPQKLTTHLLFQLGATATASQAYLFIPGSTHGEYGGIVLTDDSESAIANNKDTTGGAVRAVGQLFQVLVNTYSANSATAAAPITGFHLVWNQVPCSTAYLM